MATTYTTKINAVSSSSTISNTYELKLEVSTTKKDNNSTDVKMIGYIRSINSSYGAYNLENGASNTLKIIDEDNKTQYSASFKTKYDTRSTNSYYKLFTKTVNIVHGSDGARSIKFSWQFKETSVSYNPQGTLNSSTLALSTATYTVSYNANGGTGAPAAQTKKHGVDLTLSTTKPTRSKDDNGNTYTFDGWSESSDSSTVNYEAGGIYKANKSVTLYAVWRKTTTVVLYRISYNANGGSGAPAAQFKKEGTSITLSNTKPTRAGYTFKGWATSSTSTTVAYNPGATYSKDAGLILYAVWTPWTYTLIFDANGGTGAPSSVTKSGDIPIQIPETKPTKTNYIFKRWNTKSDGTGKSYYPLSSFDVIQNGGTITLYAIYANTDILIYSSGKCKAMDFIEGDTIAFYSTGTIVAPEFIEGSVMSISKNNFKFTELIEK